MTEDFADQLASTDPTPGGGAAAARVGELSCSLLRMVLGITLKKLRSEERAVFTGHLRDAQALATRFKVLEKDDAAAFEQFLTASRMPRATDEEKAVRTSARRAAALEATKVPLATMEAASEVLNLARVLVRLAETTPLRAESDLFAAAELARAAGQVARLNVEANEPYLAAQDAETSRERAEALEREIERVYGEVRGG